MTTMLILLVGMAGLVQDAMEMVHGRLGYFRARETTWWSIDVSDSNYPWLLYHRRGDGGDSGIS